MRTTKASLPKKIAPRKKWDEYGQNKKTFSPLPMHLNGWRDEGGENRGRQQKTYLAKGERRKVEEHKRKLSRANGDRRRGGGGALFPRPPPTGLSSRKEMEVHANGDLWKSIVPPPRPSLSPFPINSIPPPLPVSFLGEIWAWHPERNR